METAPATLRLALDSCGRHSFFVLEAPLGLRKDEDEPQQGNDFLNKLAVICTDCEGPTIDMVLVVWSTLEMITIGLVLVLRLYQ